MSPQSIDWLTWVRTLQSISQAGLTYAEDPFDRDRYEKVGRVAAQMTAAVAGLPATEIATAFATDAGDPTPKVDVRGAVFRDDKLLLVQERSDGRWTLPGGWADPGEPPGSAVAREVREETGYNVRAARLVAVHDRDLRNAPPIAFAVYKLFFLCDLLSTEAAGSTTTRSTLSIGLIHSHRRRCPRDASPCSSLHSLPAIVPTRPCRRSLTECSGSEVRRHIRSQAHDGSLHTSVTGDLGSAGCPAQRRTPARQTSGPRPQIGLGMPRPLRPLSPAATIH